MLLLRKIILHFPTSLHIDFPKRARRSASGSIIGQAQDLPQLYGTSRICHLNWCPRATQPPMCHPAMILSPLKTVMSQEDDNQADGTPGRTATGFVLGTALSGAIWVAAALLAWYIV